MQRITHQTYAEGIAEALRRIPPAIHGLVACEFFTGSDPVHAGLHRYRSTDDGRSYGDTAHAVYLLHQRHMPVARRSSTVVLPVAEDATPEVIVHELGHILDESLGFSWSADPVTWYAETNRYEAFAEAFTGWCIPDYLPGTRVDPATAALLDALAYE